ncbi:MAG: tetratricopeptide repeat protein [Gemmatimonadales bacterium]|jgi:TolB-like protein/cytochrome c-type biogenesis protein CcmH/NrfG
MKSYQQLFAELKRRKVFRVAALYGVVSFGVLQAADIMLPRLGVPDWTITFMVALVILAFPVALILAWAFEVTPDGVQRTGAAAPGEIEAIVAEPASRRWPAGVLALIGVAALVAGAWWVGRRTAPVPEAAVSASSDIRFAYADPGDDDRPSIAVLPFADMSPEGDQEYFGDGMTEEILNTLAGIDELRVAGRTSAFAFKGEHKDLREIGRELGVGYLIEGSVRKAGDKLRITAQLIDASDGSHLWSDSYDRTLEDVFAIQSEIAASVAEALRVPLGLDDASKLVTPTADLGAYDLYLAGRSKMRERGASLLEARDLFQAALARDSTWAPAWAALAEVEELRIWYAAAQPDDVSPSAFNARALEASERAARRALELDPANSSAYVALGSVYRNRAEWDESEAAYLHALELDPDNPEAHQQYGEYLLNVGRIAEAVHAMDRAAVLDPAPIRLGMLATALMDDGRFAESAETYERTLDRETTTEGKQIVLWRLAYRYALLDRWKDAAQALNRAKELDPEAAPYIGSPSEVAEFLEGIRTGDLSRIPDELREYVHSGYWMLAGQPDSAVTSALAYLSDEPFGRVLELRNPALTSVRSDPRVQAYLAERGLAGVEDQRTPPAERKRPRALGQAAR